MGPLRAEPNARRARSGRGGWGGRGGAAPCHADRDGFKPFFFLLAVSTLVNIPKEQLARASVGSQAFKDVERLQELGVKLRTTHERLVQQLEVKLPIKYVRGSSSKDDKEDDEASLASKHEEAEHDPPTPPRVVKRARTSSTKKANKAPVTKVSDESPDPGREEVLQHLVQVQYEVLNTVKNVDKVVQANQRALFQTIEVIQNEVQILRKALEKAQQSATHASSSRNDEELQAAAKKQIVIEQLLMDFIRDENSMKAFWFRMKAAGARKSDLVNSLSNCYLVDATVRDQFIASQTAEF